ncbi:efflux RND transporter permease subunit, partial [Planctomycetota bacterium]
MRLIEAFVHNPVKIAVGVLIVALFGFIALMRMPMQLTPEVEIPKISISTTWPGASPHEIEREIIQEQEEQLQSVEGVTKMSSECNNSSGSITLEFKVGSDLSEGLLKVNSRLQQVPEYPEEADEPVISTSDPRANAIGWFILRPRVASPQEIEAFLVDNPDLTDLLQPALSAHNAGLRTRRMRTLVEEHPELTKRVKDLLPPKIEVPELRLFAEDFIEARFERVPGISNSNVYGGHEEELQVVVDPQRLAARGVTLLNIRDALRRDNRDISAGDLWEGKRRYVIRTLGRFSTPEQVRDTIVAQSDDGAAIYIRDVAEVRHGFKKPTAVVKNFGTACLAINCVRETGANVLEVMKGLRRVNAALNEDRLKWEGLELIQVYDQTDYIYSAIHLVNQNIVIGGILTVIVLLLFLRSGRSTIVIALAIPTSLIGTFLMLNWMGRSLNVISLAGLAFAVGMLVDNAVVVLENCYRHSQMGDNPFTAAVRGAQEVWGAVVASTLTTLAVFLPVLFVEEEAGQLFRDIALAVSSAVGLSLLVSITVIPTAAARLLRQRNQHGEPTSGAKPARRVHLLAPVDFLGRMFVGAVVGINRFLQRSVLLRLATVILFVAVAVGLTWRMMPSVEYLPAGNRNLVIAILLPPPGYNIERSLKMGTELEDATRPYWDVAESNTPQDAAAETLDFPQISDYFFVARGRQVFMGLRAMDANRAGELVQLVYDLTENMPGTISTASQRSLFSRELATGRTVDIEITGPQLEPLIDLGKEIFFELTGDEEHPPLIPGARSFPRPSLDLNSPELHVLRKLEQAADM